MLFVFWYYFVITGLAKVWRRGLNKFNEAQSEPFCWYCCQQKDLIQHNAGPDYPRPSITVQKVSFTIKGEIKDGEIAPKIAQKYQIHENTT